MTPERWRQVTEIFHAAIATEPAQRDAFLDEACAHDRGLRADVESLIAAHHQADGFGDRPVSVTAPSLESGTSFGPYRIEGLLGAGGMGEVYRARDVKLGRDVAIKILPSEFARSPDRLERFRREARTLALLNHRNIAAIYGLEESGGLEFLVLELVEGETLAGPLPITQALDYAHQLADALEAAHRKGIIHRDLKPSNVKVTPDGSLKVLDFGLAKAMFGPDPKADASHASISTGIQTIVGHIVGTPGYMSPEQARGTVVDERTDIWAFGCLLYEMLTGARAFACESLSDTVAAVLEHEPDWRALPAKTPAKIRDLLRKCLQKDPARRLGAIADARAAIKNAQRGRNRWRIAALSAAVPIALILAAEIWRLSRPVITDRSEWVPLTKFPDSVSQPALSPDGRVLAFLRSESTFLGKGQIYLKTLPDGEPVQLTHDSTRKMSPTFSPDGSRIAYTTFPDNSYRWDTSVVATKGGEPPQPWLKNASGLTWTARRQVLFSEMKIWPHMGIVLANEDMTGARDVYLPAEEPSMAHRSYLSPNGKWVLLVEMDFDHLWLPCRVVPADGSSAGRPVGPPGGGCTAGAWSPDGRWIYLTSNAVDANHIWRQRFPNGKPEQITSGPTEEEGIAVAPDGRWFVTAVALQNTSLWVHDAKGERGISVEGNAAEPKFTPDGKKLLYRIVREAPYGSAFYRDPGEIRIADLESGRSEPLVQGFQALDYDISPDGKYVVMQATDDQGKSRLWYVPMDRSSPPRQIPNVEGASPRFGSGGDVFFRRRYAAASMVDNIGTIFRVRLDGTGARKALETPVLIMKDLSPDGRWLEAWARIPGGSPVAQLFSLDKGLPIIIGSGFTLKWSANGSVLSITGGPGVIPDGRSYLISLPPGRVIPPIPIGGFSSEAQVANLPGAQRLEARSVVPGPSPDVYAFYRGTTQRNLYRIPIH